MSCAWIQRNLDLTGSGQDAENDTNSIVCVSCGPLQVHVQHADLHSLPTTRLNTTSCELDFHLQVLKKTWKRRHFLSLKKKTFLNENYIFMTIIIFNLFCWVGIQLCFFTILIGQNNQTSFLKIVKFPVVKIYLMHNTIIDVYSKHEYVIHDLD